LVTTITHAIPGADYDQNRAAFFYIDYSGASTDWYKVTPYAGTTAGTPTDAFQVNSSYVVSLTTLAKVKQFLGLTITTDDALLTRLIAGASNWFNKQVGRNIAQNIYVDVEDGNNNDVLFLRHQPVTEVVTVSIDGANIPVRPSLTGSGYVDNGYSVLLTRDLKFTDGLQNIQVVYVAGYDPVPEEIEQAVIELVSLKYREKAHVGSASTSLAGTSVSFLPSMVPQAVKDVVELYRRPGF
jgi:uncharacterized phiE125 gp8 family phage protein